MASETVMGGEKGAITETAVMRDLSAEPRRAAALTALSERVVPSVATSMCLYRRLLPRYRQTSTGTELNVSTRIAWLPSSTRARPRRP